MFLYGGERTGRGGREIREIVGVRVIRMYYIHV